MRITSAGTSLLLMVVLVFYPGLRSRAQNKYALAIGIDKYSPPADYEPRETTGRILFPDLDGCKNDARAMLSVAVSRFGFPAVNVDSLFDEKASRNNILAALDKLKSVCKAGDFALVYYAGHGSQVKNSLSAEGDNKDESIVPADTWKEAVSDIRDKELAKIWNSFLDKGIKLTLIMDCCHSGSLSRGPIAQGKFRYIAALDVDAKDASKPLVPESRSGDNFLVLSAAQDNEFAQEQNDEQGNPHGAFTVALLKALTQQSPDASALNLFTSLRAILKGNGKKQEPVLGGSNQRQRQTLFGFTKGSVPDKSLVPVIKLSGTVIELQGGVALGLNKGNELATISNGDSIIVKIDSLIGVNKSLASLVKGDVKRLQPGQFLEVINWVSPAAPFINLYIPEKNANEDLVNKIIQLHAELAASKKVSVQKSIDEADPAVTIYFDNTTCYINVNGQRSELTDLSAASILSRCKQNDTVFLEIPPTKNVADALRARLKPYRTTLRLVDNINDANYVLYGTSPGSNNVSYGWRKVQASAKDSLESMPVTTAMIPVKLSSLDACKNLADTLFEYSLRLSKIRGWMNLTAPTMAQSQFPFTLQLRNTGVGKILDPLVYKVNDIYSLNIAGTGNFKSTSIPKKYVYVFFIDKNGTMQLIYPDAAEGNTENKFPKYGTDGNVVSSYTIADEITVSEPTGTDTYFMLASAEPINNFGLLFQQDGVRGVETTNNNPLSDLLNIGNESIASRGIEKKMPANWCLVRMSVKSTY